MLEAHMMPCPLQTFTKLFLSYAFLQLPQISDASGLTPLSGKSVRDRWTKMEPIDTGPTLSATRLPMTHHTASAHELCFGNMLSTACAMIIGLIYWILRL